MIGKLFAGAFATPHRYYRVRFTSNNGWSNNTIIADIDLYLEEGGADQCTGGTIFGTGSNTATGFDGLAETWWSADSESSGYLGYYWSEAKAITSYSILATSNYLAAMPKDFVFECSDDNTNWTVLDTQSVTDWALSTRKYFTLANHGFFNANGVKLGG